MDQMLQTGKDAETIVAEQGFDTPGLSDEDLRVIVQGVLDTNPTIVQQYKDGKTTTM